MPDLTDLDRHGPDADICPACDRPYDRTIDLTHAGDSTLEHARARHCTLEDYSGDPPIERTAYIHRDSP